MKIIKKEYNKFLNGFIFYLENGKELSVCFDLAEDRKWYPYFLAESSDNDGSYYENDDLDIVSKESGLSKDELEVIIGKVKEDEDVKERLISLDKETEDKVKKESTKTAQNQKIISFHMIDEAWDLMSVGEKKKILEKFLRRGRIARKVNNHKL